MASESSVFGLSLLAVVGGLAILLYGAENTANAITFSGGLVVLSGVAIMTVYLAGMDGPAEGH